MTWLLTPSPGWLLLLFPVAILHRPGGRRHHVMDHDPAGARAYACCSRRTCAMSSVAFSRLEIGALLYWMPETAP